MLKKRITFWNILFILFILLIVFAFLAIYTAINGNPVSDFLMERETKAFLLKQGYKEKEILSIEASYNLKRNTERIKGTNAYVTFEDEPNERYLYIQWRESKQIQQHCEYYNEQTQSWEQDFTEKRKHMDKSCTTKY